jgi:hypothetical protein
MDELTIRRKLQSFAGNRKKVRLTRAMPSEQLHNGYVAGVGREWLLLRQFHDFAPDGTIALRVKDVIRFRSSKYEQHWDQMLAGEGILDRLEFRSDLPLDNVGELLRALQSRQDNVIVECEDQEEDVQDFYIGQILLVEDDLLYFANFDPLGCWDKSHDLISLEEITSIQFDTPYIQTFSKYLKASCPHKRHHQAS